VFRATPSAILMFSGWAGYAVFSDVFWFLGSVGRIDDYGDWSSYREIAASSLGIPFGLWLGYIVVSGANKAWRQMLSDREIAPITWLEYELSGRKGEEPGKRRR